MSTLYFDQGTARTGTQKVLLATTAYDNTHAAYTFSIQRSRELLHKHGIETAYLLLSGNCHVDDARNSVIQEFIDTDCTDIVFLDADVAWEPEQLVRLCQHDADIVGGVYPFRSSDKLDDMPVRMIQEASPNDCGLIEVEGLPAGFMRIRRDVIVQLSMHAESYALKKSDGLTTVYILFERTLESGTRWGGDLKFCHKWRALGGKVYADYEMRLGHACKEIIYGSLAEVMRRRLGTTLRDICEKIRKGTWTVHDLAEARRYDDNKFGASNDVLSIAVGFAAKANGPIIEAGSGLTTVLMAAATEHTVYCLEHHEGYAERLRMMAREAGVGNIGLCVCPIKDNWYDLTGKTLPKHFSVGLNDGPPRQLSNRHGFMDVFGEQVDVMVCDDADDQEYRTYLTSWSDTRNLKSTFVQPRAMVIQ